MSQLVTTSDALHLIIAAIQLLLWKAMRTFNAGHNSSVYAYHRFLTLHLLLLFAALVALFGLGMIANAARAVWQPLNLSMLGLGMNAVALVLGGLELVYGIWEDFASRAEEFIGDEEKGILQGEGQYNGRA